MQSYVKHFCRPFYISGLLSLLLAVHVTAGENLTVTKVDGSQIRGDLVTWNAQGITIKTSDATLTVESPDLLRIKQVTTESELAPIAQFVELVDGTRLPVDSYEVTDGKATLATPLATAPLRVPTGRIKWVQLMPAAPELPDTELEGDVLVIYKKKTNAYDSLTGILGDVSADQVQFSWEGETIPVKRTKVAALAYFHANDQIEQDPVCWLNTESGARLPVADLVVKDAHILVHTWRDQTFSIPLTSLQIADYSFGKLVYLSDLKPIKETWTPKIGLPNSAELIKRHGLPRRDQSFAGSNLSLIWPNPKTGLLRGTRKIYDKGLAMRSRTVSRYRVPKGMGRFMTTAGIDPETATEGHVTLELFIEGQSLWRGDIAGGAEPTEINVEIGDARQLRIVVDYGENLDFGDRLHLAEARFSR